MVNRKVWQILDICFLELKSPRGMMLPHPSPCPPLLFPLQAHAAAVASCLSSAANAGADRACNFLECYAAVYRRLAGSSIAVVAVPRADSQKARGAAAGIVYVKQGLVGGQGGNGGGSGGCDGGCCGGEMCGEAGAAEHRAGRGQGVGDEINIGGGWIEEVLGGGPDSEAQKKQGWQGSRETAEGRQSALMMK